MPGNDDSNLRSPMKPMMSLVIEEISLFGRNMASYSKKPSDNGQMSNYIVSLCKNAFLLDNDVCCQIALSVFAKINCVIVFKLADYNPLSTTRRMFFLLLEIW